LCTLFLFASLLVFLHYRAPRMGIAASIAVLILFACGVLTKEQAAVLPAVFFATDIYWRDGPWLRALARNWKLYVPLAAGGVFGVFVIRETLRFAGTAGFNMKDLQWWEYFLTQCRVIWMYIRLIVLPFGQNVDHDVAISRGLMDHGALLGLLALIAAVVGAWWIRGKYPLVLFGLLTALLLLAPTSSFMPIRDVVAEHRVYAPLLGFILMALEGVRRLRMTKGIMVAGTAVLVALGVAAHARASLYGSDIAIWADTVEKSPKKVRPRFQLAYAYMKAGRCAEAEAEFARTAALDKPDMPLLVDWALSLDCLGQNEEAIAKLKQAIEVEASASPYSQLGMVYGKLGRNQEALAALDAAIKLDPNLAKAYVYRGNVLGVMGEWGKAIAEYKRALQIDPDDRDAMQNMSVAEGQLRRSP
jgi:tetratricopeptide (TPR) repeat protein